MDADVTVPVRSSVLTVAERRALRERSYRGPAWEILADLLKPFEHAFERWTMPQSSDPSRTHALHGSFHLCGQMMLDLDCTYWTFTWERILAWKACVLAHEEDHPSTWRHAWETKWTRVTSTLFFLGVLPYSEEIHRTYHRELAEKWLGSERAREIEGAFLATALAMGYKHERQLRKQGASVLLTVLVATGKTDLATLTKADLEQWQAQTARSKRVARASVTCIQHVLAAMGYLGGEAPRTVDNPGSLSFTWGFTAPAIGRTFERFLADLATVRRPGTVGSYKVALRRFGDWLGSYDPAVTSVAEVRRHHIEAYKQAVTGMRCGDHTNVGAEFQVINLGEPLSQAQRVRSISCVKAFFERIDVLEYPERPNRTLFVRGDVARVDEQFPRHIPDVDWRRLVEAVQQLTPESIGTHHFPLPMERTQAMLAILLECGLRAGELCRLDTGCLIAARESETAQETHWLRVPVGKLHNDRLIPIRPHLVAAIDGWMRIRGRQPMGRDERTGKPRDYLFTWQGRQLSTYSLNHCIARLCTIAGTPKYTSHAFRHTLAVLWRARGMRLETISRLLGHKSLQMTLRYAAVMPATLRHEFETAFAAIDEEHRATAQVRVVLSPEAHLAARLQWRESLFVDLGIGWCGLTAYHPCETRLACHRCPNFIPDKERLPLLEQQRANLIELRGIGETRVPQARQQGFT
ncbi:MAG TPA: site-specific integrase [Chloroflexota bacterium]|nr:site-specific integrase [Chloroflexota bacterium]